MLKKYWYIIVGLIAYFLITNKSAVAPPKYKTKISIIPKNPV